MLTVPPSRAYLDPEPIIYVNHLSSLADCLFNPGQGALEQFADDSQNLAALGIQSVQCFENVGTVDGLTAGSPEANAQEVADSDAADGFVPSPPLNCTEGPVPASPEEQAQAAADGVILSGPVTCT